ncbi:MAG: hypothetical protein IJP07_02995 [Firmicutes bacterium]|nr:hypothetical protein [Bacillota bacterium]
MTNWNSWGMFAQPPMHDPRSGPVKDLSKPTFIILCSLIGLMMLAVVVALLLYLAK